MLDIWGRLLRDERAATSIEYCLIAAGIGLAAFGAVTLVGPALKNIFASIARRLDSANSPVLWFNRHRMGKTALGGRIDPERLGERNGSIGRCC
jgi:Flp pilus assembly pilin Flp